MKLFIISRNEDEQHRLGISEKVLDIDLLSPESRRGQEISGLYGVVQYPAFVLTSDDGQLTKLWQGSQISSQDVRNNIAFV